MALFSGLFLPVFLDCCMELDFLEVSPKGIPWVFGSLSSAGDME